MPITKMDERRRITISRKIAEEFDAKEFVVVPIRGEGILLKPLPKDPVKALQKLGKKLKGKSIKQLRKEAYEEAMKEAGR